MTSEQSSETGYGLVKTPGSIVTDFGKSQLVDPGWSKFDFDQNLCFSYSFKPNKALYTHHMKMTLWPIKIKINIK